MKDTYEAEDEVDDAVEDAEHAQHDREAAAAAVKPLQPSASPRQVFAYFFPALIVCVAAI